MGLILFAAFAIYIMYLGEQIPQCSAHPLASNAFVQCSLHARPAHPNPVLESRWFAWLAGAVIVGYTAWRLARRVAS